MADEQQRRRARPAARRADPPSRARPTCRSSSPPAPRSPWSGVVLELGRCSASAWRSPWSRSCAGSARRARRSRTCRSSTSTRRAAPPPAGDAATPGCRARRGALAARTSRGISDVAPSCTQQRTMSRIERMPTRSPPSTTTRWRKPPRTIASAARSSDHSGSAKVRLAERWSATFSVAGVLPGAERVEHVALGHDARARAARGRSPRRRRRRARTSPGRPGSACGRAPP